MTDQQQDMQTNDVHETSDEAARQRRLLEAFKEGLPRGPDSSIDMNAAGNLLIENGADVPTLMVMTHLAKLHMSELQKAEQPKFANFAESLQGRPRSTVVGFPPDRRSARPPWYAK
jgi:hypothetical protein